MLDELEALGGVSSLVIVPGDDLDEPRGKGNTGLGVKDRCAGVANEVRRDNHVLSVTEHASHGALSSCLHGGADLLIGGVLGKVDGKVNHGDIDDGDTDRHTGELAVELGDDLADGLGSAGGGGDKVAEGSTASTPVLAGGGVDGGLGGGDSVNGVHETGLNAPSVVEDLGDRGKAVGGA